MNKHILIILSIFAFVLTGLADQASAAQGEYKTILAATPEHPNAGGTLLITDTSIAIEAKGLKSNFETQVRRRIRLSATVVGKAGRLIRPIVWLWYLQHLIT